MPFRYLHLPWAFFMLCCIFASSSIFSDTEDLDLDDFDDLDLFPFVIDDYEDIASVLDHSDILLNDDLFSADILTSCLGDNNVVQLGKLRTRDSSCPAPEIPINIPQFPNILPSTQEPHALPPTLLENQGDLATTRPAEYFCSSPKYRGDIRFGRVPVPVCGPALPLQQGWPGSGVQGYYVNVEYSRLISLLAPFCPVEDVFCCQFWKPYSLQRPEWNYPADLGVGILCFHLIELGWTGYDEFDIPDSP